MDNSLAALAAKVGNGSPSHLQRLECLVSTVPVVIYTCKADGDFGATFVSDGVRARWGYEPEEFLKDRRFWVERLHPEDADRIIAGLALCSRRTSTATNIVSEPRVASIAGRGMNFACCEGGRVNRWKSWAIVST